VETKRLLDLERHRSESVVTRLGQPGPHWLVAAWRHGCPQSAVLEQMPMALPERQPAPVLAEATLPVQRERVLAEVQAPELLAVRAVAVPE
jgi:hypothetical protein